jgi:cytochrome c556
MKRAFWAVPGLLALSVVAGFCADDLSIEDIMTKAHKNKTGLRDQIAAELKKSTPDWSDVQKKTKEFSKLAGSLPKLKPEKGDPNSWKKLSEAYAAEVKTLDDAASKKDKDMAAKINEKLKTSCTPCHDVHRE